MRGMSGYLEANIRKIIFCVPPTAVDDTEKFLKSHPQFLRAEIRPATICEISDEGSHDEVEAKQYEVFIKGDDKGAERFISTLIAAGFLPKGKIWRIYYSPLSPESKLSMLDTLGKSCKSC